MFINLAVFLIILSILVLIHELGHFLMAKKLGIKVEEFGFGLPPRAFGIKFGETVYSINWLPIGGFVRLFGEEGPEEQSKKAKDKDRAFYSRPVSHRVLVIVAGVFMNFVLAVFVISYLFTNGVMIPTDRVHIEKILDNSPAFMAGLKENDVIKQIINRAGPAPEITDIKNGDVLSKTAKQYLGKEIILTVERDAQIIEVPIVPRVEYPSDQGPMGIVISNYEMKKYPISQAPFLGLKESFVLSWELVKGIGKTVWKMISFQPVSKDVAGPIGIYEMTGQALKFGWKAVLEMLGLLSLNLAIINILPFPALDGGRLLFIIIEKITGKRVHTNIERYIHQIGMFILIFLIVLVTINDIMRIISR